jgi:ADP-dependent NAD(P)H-hydrate dehydratase
MTEHKPSQILSGQLLRSQWPLPATQDDGDKHSRGTVAVIGGAMATPGAVLLAGVAALRVGAGKLSIGTVEATATTLVVAVPEAGVTGLSADEDGDLGGAATSACASLLSDADVALLGPGMSGPAAAKEFLGGLCSHINKDTVIVLDALAITCGALDDIARRLEGRVVITPNSTEASLLLDEQVASDEAAAARLAQRHNVVAVLGSAVATPQGAVWRKLNGNPGLGTSGSGDVLAGAIAGIAARGATPTQAAIWGLFLHSSAGDRLAARVGGLGYLARELLDELPRALRA